MASSPKTPPSGGHLPVFFPPDLKPTYANFALITHSRSEIVLDFAQVMPRVPQARVQNRVVMTAFNAKLLQRALNEHMTRFETQHGEIELPEGTSLADQLFRPPNDENEADDGES